MEINAGVIAGVVSLVLALIVLLWSMIRNKYLTKKDEIQNAYNEAMNDNRSKRKFTQLECNYVDRVSTHYHKILAKVIYGNDLDAAQNWRYMPFITSDDTAAVYLKIPFDGNSIHCVFHYNQDCIISYQAHRTNVQEIEQSSVKRVLDALGVFNSRAA